jgi:hypothetical protein
MVMVPFGEPIIHSRVPNLARSLRPASMSTTVTPVAGAVAPRTADLEALLEHDKRPFETESVVANQVMVVPNGAAGPTTNSSSCCNIRWNISVRVDLWAAAFYALYQRTRRFMNCEGSFSLYHAAAKSYYF